MNKYSAFNVHGERGVVHKFQNKETQQIVAVKEIQDHKDDEIATKNIQREVKILQQLHHRNIVNLIEVIHSENKIYLVFEFIEKNLLEILETKPTGLDPEVIRVIIYQLLQALEYCHKQGVVHRDLKPENILVSPENFELKLCDFSFARSLPLNGNEPLTDYVSTRWYRSPELILNSPNYSKPADIWAVACIMGELINGQPLFPGENEIDQLYLIQKALGPISQEQTEAFHKNPSFGGIKFPVIPKSDMIEKRFYEKSNEAALNFMMEMLKIDPFERITAQEALKHKYFDGIHEQYDFEETLAGVQLISGKGSNQQHLHEKTEVQEATNQIIPHKFTTEGEAINP